MGRKAKNNPGFKRTYIYKVLKQVHPDAGTSVNGMHPRSTLSQNIDTFHFLVAMQIVDDMLMYSFRIILKEAVFLVEKENKSTLTSRYIYLHCWDIIDGQLFIYVDGSQGNSNICATQSPGRIGKACGV